MKMSAKGVLVSCCGLMFLVSAANAMTMTELQAEYANVLATCNSEAGSLSGASRSSFVLKCRTEKTSPQAKVKSCELQMEDEISRKAQQDPEIRKKWIDNCVRRWNPKIG